MKTCPVFQLDFKIFRSYFNNQTNFYKFLQDNLRNSWTNVLKPVPSWITALFFFFNMRMKYWNTGYNYYIEEYMLLVILHIFIFLIKYLVKYNLIYTHHMNKSLILFFWCHFLLFFVKFKVYKFNVVRQSRIMLIFFQLSYNKKFNLF